MSVEINQWAFNMLRKTETLFQPNIYEGKYHEVFLSFIQLYEQQSQAITPACCTMAVTVAVWTLARIFRTQDPHVKEQYEHFLDQLLLLCLLMEKIMKLEDAQHQKISVTTQSMHSTIVPPQTILPPDTSLPM